MSITYGGQKQTLGQKIGGLVPFVDRKAALPLTPSLRGLFPAWQSASWLDKNFNNFVEYGYKGNGAVFACVQALAIGFSEPPLCVFDTKTKEKIPDDQHELYTLLRRPNPLMGQKELWQYHLTYEPLGGNGYIYQVTTNGKKTAQLWPYNAGQMWAVPDTGAMPDSWIKEFRYATGNNTSIPIETKAVIHTKWMPDIDFPWRGMSALEPVWREVQADNELTRFLKAVVQNDAVVRNALELPPGVTLSDKVIQKMRERWREMFGGDNRGDLAILQGGAKLVRMSLNMQELQLEALRYIPESRICAAFNMDPSIPNLFTGSVQKTYANYEEAGRDFTDKTLKPKWDLLADELTHNLVPEYDTQGRVYLAFDLSQVQALKEDVNVKAVWVVNAWDKGLLTVNQSLTLLGQTTLEGSDGDVRKTVAQPMALQAVPAATPTGGKALGGAGMETKEVPVPVAKLEAKIAKQIEAHLKETYDGVASVVGKQ